MTHDLGKLLRRNLRYIVVIVATLVCVTLATQTTLEDVFEEIKSLNELAKETQSQINHLESEHLDLKHKYRNKLKTIDGLKVHNRSLDLQIAKQKDDIEVLRESIAEVDLIQSEITPLMARMIEGLDNFIKLDKPFELEERTQRVADLREVVNRYDVEISEKFAQVLRAYEIESDFGRTMDVSQKKLALPPDGEEHNVNILRVGRIALVYQTLQGDETGWWNPHSKEWERLPNKYNTPIKNGIKMANKQLTSGLFQVPILAPEDAEEEN
ncbi:MAG: DUF3450 domain-containing protein [Gammaproteobacteria bacterium]|nr:DUF3450 domain-containing protein [Gammaproteobacteria bacterium]MYF02933.1 DUF3450 domain-containing protein [Gammaproteobacteria bacterium]MYI76249.1 DUF3450 domain-containing protein [Gammaproteobacteria bacterium]